jgi:hypothetical protein
MSTSPSNWDYSIHSIPPSESQEAAQAYRALRANIARIEEGDKSTKSLVSSAKKIITEFSTRPESDRVFTYGIGRDGEERPSLNLDKVLSAMVTYSRGCGGDEGQRYVASTIVACRGKESGETSAESKHLTVWELVRAIAITWVTHFLFVCEYRVQKFRAAADLLQCERTRIIPHRRDSQSMHALSSVGQPPTPAWRENREVTWCVVFSSAYSNILVLKF